MKKLANLKYKLLSLIVFIAVYSVIVFVWASNTTRGVDKSVITAYILFMISMVCLIVALFMGNSHKVPGAIEAVNAPASVALYFAIISFIYTSILYFFNFEKYMVAIILVFVFLFGIFLIFFIFSMKQRELINRNPNKIPALANVKDVPAYLTELANKVTEENTKKMFEDLVSEALNMVEIEENEEVKQIDNSIIEYCGYLNTNVNRSEYSNAYNNINKVKELINKRNNLGK